MEFIRAVLSDALTLLRTPAFLLPGLAISVAASGAVALSGWPGPNPLKPTYAGLLTVILSILGRGWLMLSLAAMGLAMLRGERASLGRQWVHVAVALEVGLVSLVLGIAILAGTVALIVPGVYLLVLWSQAALVIVDGQARLLAAGNWSASLTDGFRLEILGVWAIVFSGFALVELIGSAMASTPLGGLPAALLIAVTWTWRAIAATSGVALAAAIYLELSSRAPWQPELERVRPGADARVEAVMRESARRRAAASRTDGQ